MSDRVCFHGHEALCLYGCQAGEHDDDVTLPRICVTHDVERPPHVSGYTGADILSAVVAAIEKEPRGE